jgi:hypothetical protein
MLGLFYITVPLIVMVAVKNFEVKIQGLHASASAGASLQVPLPINENRKKNFKDLYD